MTTVVGLGEALFDLLPGGPVLGGAPLNVAVHAQQLGARGVLVSRVGRDALGDRLRDEVARRGLDASGLQVDPDRPTGTVAVTLEKGEPRYEITKDVAWDRLEFAPALAASADAVCFGTLAQRSPRSREAIRRFLEAAPKAARLFDVNLRQDYYSRDILHESLRRATMVKLNRDELPVVLGLLGMSDLDALRAAYGLTHAVLTRGAEGTSINGVEGEPVRFPAQAGADSVGAGDACSAGVLMGVLRGWTVERTLSLANRLGAYVASVPGATPRLPFTS
ncbi:MAG TPA: carbohydrate kinase [Planctomycetota bacterium]